MNWIEKVRYLKHRKETEAYNKEYYIDIAPEKVCWQKDELENIVKNYDYIPKEYIEFLKEFDNLGLSFVTFYGSKAGKIIPLSDEIEELSEYTDIFQKEYFPFGKDVDGSVFAFNQKQEVVWFDIEDYDFENPPKKIADSFEEFVGDCLIGKRYHEFDYIEDNTYYDFLKSLGWL